MPNRSIEVQKIPNPNANTIINNESYFRLKLRDSKQNLAFASEMEFGIFICDF